MPDNDQTQTICLATSRPDRHGHTPKGCPVVRVSCSGKMTARVYIIDEKKPGTAENAI